MTEMRVMEITNPGACLLIEFCGCHRLAHYTARARLLHTSREFQWYDGKLPSDFLWITVSVMGFCENTMNTNY